MRPCKLEHPSTLLVFQYILVCLVCMYSRYISCHCCLCIISYCCRGRRVLLQVCQVSSRTSYSNGDRVDGSSRARCACERGAAGRTGRSSLQINSNQSNALQTAVTPHNKPLQIQTVQVMSAHSATHSFSYFLRTHLRFYHSNNVHLFSVDL